MAEMLSFFLFGVAMGASVTAYAVSGRQAAPSHRALDPFSPDSGSEGHDVVDWDAVDKYGHDPKLVPAHLWGLTPHQEETKRFKDRMRRFIAADIDTNGGTVPAYENSFKELLDKID